MNDDSDVEGASSTSSPFVKVHYWFGEGDLNGIGEFSSELSDSYSSSEVKGLQGGLGGGLYTLLIEITSVLTLPYFLQLIIDGIAFDLIKLGARNLVLRPLLVAQKNCGPEINTTIMLTLFISNCSLLTRLSRSMLLVGLGKILRIRLESC